MVIRTATFVKSSAGVEQCPAPTLPEYAFIGRSNVGKSSLLNMLAGMGGLAKVSGTPGKTQLINHYLINSLWYLVDLPGYGYAKVSKRQREGFAQVITRYIGRRENLYALFVLIDSRLPPQPIDLAFIQWLGEQGVPFALAFTKTDKLSGTALHGNLAVYRQTLSSTWEELPPLFTTSAVTGAGRDTLLAFIDSANRSAH